jgi:hypothetical protein
MRPSPSDIVRIVDPNGPRVVTKRMLLERLKRRIGENEARRAGLTSELTEIREKVVAEDRIFGLLAMSLGPNRHEDISLTDSLAAADVLASVGIRKARTGLEALLMELDSAARQRTSCRLYFIQAGDGPIKIGISDDPAARLRDLQCGNAEELRILLTEAGNIRAEQVAHQAFERCRIRGEWFRKEGGLAAFLKIARELSSGAFDLDRAARELREVAA